jgi:predicted RNA-binding Zn-ribbon protein involved in translation (DUF1610 family)
MTVKDNYTKVSNKSLLCNNNPITNINPASKQQRSYLCDECGFSPCICEYIVGLDAETGFWVVDDWGEL